MEREAQQPGARRKDLDSGFGQSTICQYCGEDANTGIHAHFFQKLGQRLRGEAPFEKKPMKHCLTCGAGSDVEALACSNPSCGKTF